MSVKTHIGPNCAHVALDSSIVLKDFIVFTSTAATKKGLALSVSILAQRASGISARIILDLLATNHGALTYYKDSFLSSKKRKPLLSKPKSPGLPLANNPLKDSKYDGSALSTCTSFIGPSSMPLVATSRFMAHACNDASCTDFSISLAFSAGIGSACCPGSCSGSISAPEPKSSCVLRRSSTKCRFKSRVSVTTGTRSNFSNNSRRVVLRSAAMRDLDIASTVSFNVSESRS